MDHRSSRRSPEIGGARRNQMSSIYKSTTLWTGNTYPIRDAIKSLGGKWDPERKAWIVPSLSMRERGNVYAKCDGLRGVSVTAIE